MMRFWFLFIFCPLFATVNIPFTADIYTGYRNDQIHWYLKEPGDSFGPVYDECLKNVQYWENKIVLRSIYRDLSFYLEGDYGAFGRGEGEQTYPGSFSNRLKVKGWCADVLGYFGYAVNLTAGRVYQVILIPNIGYLGSFEHLKRKPCNPAGSFDPLKITWNGVFLGVGGLIQPSEGLDLSLRYAYFFIHNKTKASSQTGFISGGGEQDLRSSLGGNHGHLGNVSISWALRSNFQFGLSGEIRYFTTAVSNAKIRPAEANSSEDKLKLRFTSLGGGAFISRQF